MNAENINNLKIVLDFVERWNKMDKESDVADAAGALTEFIMEEMEKQKDDVIGGTEGPYVEIIGDHALVGPFKIEKDKK